MTDKLYQRVLKEYIVDTRKYRYMIDYDRMAIVRIELYKLDTVAACQPWEIVHQIRRKH